MERDAPEHRSGEFRRLAEQMEMRAEEIAESFEHLAQFHEEIGDPRAAQERCFAAREREEAERFRTWHGNGEPPRT